MNFFCRLFFLPFIADVRGDDVSKQRALHKIYYIGATSSTTTLTPQKLVSLLIDWFIISIYVPLILLDLRECRDGNDNNGRRRKPQRLEVEAPHNGCRS